MLALELLITYRWETAAQLGIAVVVASVVLPWLRARVVATVRSPLP